MKSYHNSNNQSVPDNALYSSIRNGKASIPETLAYYEALQNYLAQNRYEDPKYGIALDQMFMIEQILDSAGVLPGPRAVEFNLNPETEVGDRTRLEKTYSRQKTLEELQSEILAAATCKNSKLALTRVAAINNLAFDWVEHLAKSMLKDQGLDSQFDLVKVDYQRCMAEVRDIELKEDPGEKDWRLQDTAKKYHRTVKEILEAYSKSLIVQHVSDPVTLKQLKEQYGQGREWLLRGWIPKESLILLHAHGGTGKTLFAHHLIKHIVTGIDWDEYKVKAGRQGVLYIQTDTSPNSMIESVNQAGIHDDMHILYHTSWRFEYMSALYRWVKQHKPALVVIDSLTSANRFSTVSENDTLYARPILSLRDISMEFGCSFILIHHSNADGNMRGTKAIKAAVDEEWQLKSVNEKDMGDPERVLTIQKSRSRMPMKYRLKFDDDNFAWDLLEPEEEEGKPVQNSSARWLIVNHLNKHPGVRYCAEDLAHELKIPESTLRRELPGLYREGLIDRELNPGYNCNTKGQPKHLYLLRG